MAERRLSKNMQRVVAGKKRRDAYLASDEYAESRDRLVQWMVEQGYPDEAVERARRDWQPVRQRMRRGKLVAIPEPWQGVVTYPQTIRKRQPVSRRTRKEHK